MLTDNRNVPCTTVRSLDFTPGATGRSEGHDLIYVFKHIVQIFATRLIRKNNIKI